MRSLTLALLLLAAPAALAATPPEARARKEQGDTLRKAGDNDGATAAYLAALQLDGGYAEAHEALGKLYYATKQPAKAIESFGYAAEIDPTFAMAWYNLGFVASQSGDQPKARGAYQAYVKLRPTDADGHYRLAEVERALGNKAAAMAGYQLFLDLARTAPDQAPRVEKATAALAELRGPAPAAPPPSAAAPSQSAPVAAAVVGAALAGGAAAATAPATPAAVPVVVAPVATVQALPQEPAPVAVPASSPPAQRAPPTPTSAAPVRGLIEKLGAGDRAFLSGDYRAALFTYQDAVYLDPTSAGARIKLARAYSALRHREEAERQLRQALELDPGNELASKLLRELDAPSPSPASPATGFNAAPPPPAAASGQKVYRLTDDVASTPPPAPVPAQAPAPAPGDQQQATSHYKTAVAMIGARDFKGAIIELDQALRLNPRLAVALVARASACYGLARYKDAARDYEAALLLAPELASPLYGLAESYRLLEDPRAGDFYARYAESTADDVRPDLREVARQMAVQLGAR
jgi:tetratricopeptide (TPR) repeat protein